MSEPENYTYWMDKYGFTREAAMGAAYASSSTVDLRYDVIDCLMTGQCLATLCVQQGDLPRALVRSQVKALASRYRHLQLGYAAN